MTQKGRPRKKVDPDLVCKLAMIGCSFATIASHCGISHDTLQRRFRRLIDRARADGHVQALGRLYQLMMKGNVRCLELFLVNQVGWSSKPETIINIAQNSATTLPSPTEMGRRLAAAQKFLEDHKNDYDDGNGSLRPM